MNKAQLRSTVRNFLHTLTDQQYRQRSLQIAERLLVEQAIIEAKTIAVTMSNKPEVDTTYMIEQLWRLGKQVVVPKCQPKTRQMQFFKIEGFHQLEKVYMDLLEPDPAMTSAVEKECIDCIIVPGIVFDRSGYRIGFGGGYYDRYLQDYAGIKISLAFQEQLVERVPREAHDLPTQIILTENERITASNGEMNDEKYD